MSGYPWTLSLSLSVVRCRLLKKRDNDDLVGMQLNITHKLSSFLSVWSMAGLDMADHGGQVGVHRVEQIGDLAQAVVDCGQPGGHPFVVVADWVTRLGWCSTAEHGGEVLGMPAQRNRQRFQRPRAPSPLDGVMLKFTHDRLGYVRALRELALSPSQFVHALFDGIGDRHPILRHVFLRAPPSPRG